MSNDQNIEQIIARRDSLKEELSKIQNEKAQIQQRLSLLTVDEHRLGGAIALINEIEENVHRPTPGQMRALDMDNPDEAEDD